MWKLIAISTTPLLGACVHCQCPDPVGTDYWQTTAETKARGCGDCEDLAFLYHKELEGSYFVLGTIDGAEHAWVEDDGVVIDPCRNSGERIPLSKFRAGHAYPLMIGYEKWVELQRREGHE